MTACKHGVAMSAPLFRSLGRDQESLPGLGKTASEPMIGPDRDNWDLPN